MLAPGGLRLHPTSRRRTGLAARSEQRSTAHRDSCTSRGACRSSRARSSGGIVLPSSPWACPSCPADSPALDAPACFPWPDAPAQLDGDMSMPGMPADITAADRTGMRFRGEVHARLLAHTPAHARPECLGRECRSTRGDSHSAAWALSSLHAVSRYGRPSGRSWVLMKFMGHGGTCDNEIPIARVAGNELDLAHLGHSHQGGCLPAPMRSGEFAPASFPSPRT